MPLLLSQLPPWHINKAALGHQGIRPVQTSGHCPPGMCPTPSLGHCLLSHTVDLKLAGVPLWWLFFFNPWMLELKVVYTSTRMFWFSFKMTSSTQLLNLWSC